MEIKKFNRMMKDFPWLWGIRKSYYISEIEIKVEKSKKCFGFIHIKKNSEIWRFYSLCYDGYNEKHINEVCTINSAPDVYRDHYLYAILKLSCKQWRGQTENLCVIIPHVENPRAKLSIIIYKKPLFGYLDDIIG